MDRRLIEAYNGELGHVRQAAGEFAARHPDVARALNLSAQGICNDPHVERLLEGFAFLTARVQLKLEAEFPRFTQGLLETLYPHYVTPTPSMAIAQFEPKMGESALLQGLEVPRGTRLTTQRLAPRPGSPGDRLDRRKPQPCIYQTAHALRLWPITLAQADYLARDLGVVKLPPGLGVAAALCLRLQLPEGLTFAKAKLGVDSLQFYIRELGRSAVAERLHEQLIAQHGPVIVQSVRDPAQRFDEAGERHVCPVGFADHEALLPNDPRTFPGYRLLREYFAFPQRFLFFEVNGLQDAFSQCPDREVNVVITLKRADPQLEGRVDKSHLALYCTPVVNLFSKDLDPVAVDSRFHEFHVVPDRQRPLDFELFQIESVTGHGPNGPTEFKPFYFASDRHPKQTSYFTVYRVARPLTLDETTEGAESAYVGSEVYVSLVDTALPPFGADVRELHLSALCTNRHLPGNLALSGGAADFAAGGGLPCVGIRCLSGPTRPSCSCVEGKLAWRVISHLSFNHLSLVRGLGVGGVHDAAALRELLQVYADMGGAETAAEASQRIAALRTVACRPVVERLQTAVDPLALIRGLEVKLEFSESISGGVFLLAAVLERFLARAVSINSFVKTIVTSDQRPLIIEWPPRIGTRESL